MSLKIPKVLFLFVAFSFFTEMAIGIFFSIYHNNPTNTKIKVKIDIAQKSNLQSELLVFAGSEGAMGIDGNLLEKLTGRRCFNFALIGDATLAGEYFLFEEYLHHNSPPKYLLLVNSYSVWVRDFGYSSVADTLTINFPAQTARYFGSSVFTRLLPSQRYRYEIRALLRSRDWGAYLSGLRDKSARIKDDLLRHKGSVLFDENVPGDIREDIKAQEEFIKNNTFFVTALNRYGLENFFRKAREKGITVFVSFGPIEKEFIDHYGDRPYIAAYRSFMRDLPLRYPGVILLNDDFFAVGEDYLARGIVHINARGAQEFTRWIADGILKQAGREKK
jgi:hypothetical protein